MTWMYPLITVSALRLSKILLAVRVSSRTFEESFVEFLNELFIIFNTLCLVVFGIFSKSRKVNLNIKIMNS